MAREITPLMGHGNCHLKFTYFFQYFPNLIHFDKKWSKSNQQSESEYEHPDSNPSTRLQMKNFTFQILNLNHNKDTTQMRNPNQFISPYQTYTQA